MERRAKAARGPISTRMHEGQDTAEGLVTSGAEQQQRFLSRNTLKPLLECGHLLASGVPPQLLLNLQVAQQPAVTDVFRIACAQMFRGCCRRSLLSTSFLSQVRGPGPSSFRRASELRWIA